MQAVKPFLRVVTAGSVDDGKSTLVGRLIFETGCIPKDEADALLAASRAAGMQGGIDYSLIFDGLEAEREQGITIDVAHRYFRSDQRTFQVLDSPGHEQYTRNMATAASQADAAIVLVDATKGHTRQTGRHLAILALFGITSIGIALNKMDLIGFDRDRFAALSDDLAALSKRLGLVDMTVIPISARDGDNVMAPSPSMPWYRGPTLLGWLEQCEPGRDDLAQPFRMPIQMVERDAQSRRFLLGTVVSGRLAVGHEIISAVTGVRASVKAIHALGSTRDEAGVGEAISIELSTEVDVGRGDLLADAKARPHVADQFAARLVWVGDEPMLPGRSCLLQIGTRIVPATISRLKHEIDIETGDARAASTLVTNAIGAVNVATTGTIPFDAYRDRPATGGFILIDRTNFTTVAVGFVDFPLNRADNVHPQAFTITNVERGDLKGQTPCVIWLTGLPGSGKSTIANLVESELFRRGAHSFVLDGDNLRLGLNKDLGFTPADRVENVRRAGEVARLMMDAGLIVVLALVSPFRADRASVRDRVGDQKFIEVFVDAPVEMCMARDPKGLYAKANEGKLTNLTGIGQDYEAPASPDIHLDTVKEGPQACAQQVLDFLIERGFIGGRRG